MGFNPFTEIISYNELLLYAAVPLQIRAMTWPPRMRQATVLKSHLGAEKRFSSCNAGVALLAASIISKVAANTSNNGQM